jgi:hypothetical protein
MPTRLERPRAGVSEKLQGRVAAVELGLQSGLSLVASIEQVELSAWCAPCRVLDRASATEPTQRDLSSPEGRCVASQWGGSSICRPRCPKAIREMRCCGRSRQGQNRALLSSTGALLMRGMPNNPPVLRKANGGARTTFAPR